MTDVTAYDNWSSGDSAVSSMHSPTLEVTCTLLLQTLAVFDNSIESSQSLISDRLAFTHSSTTCI